jgi:agmatine deiminase
VSICAANLHHHSPDAASPSSRPWPDWRKNRVITVDPACWSYCRQQPVLSAFEALHGAIQGLGIPHQVLTGNDHPADIWIRDWGPVEGTYFRFQPSYAPKLYPASVIRSARAELNARLGFSPFESDLILDGGNLVHNGKIALLTEKVLHDNPQLSRKAIEHRIMASGFERVVFIPIEPEDVIGHADGVLRFVAPDVLLLNDYAGTGLQSYGKRLLASLRVARLGAEIIPFPCFTTEKHQNGIWSAVGCYINFLQTGQGIIAPAFGHRDDAKAVAILSRFAPVRPVETAPIAELGGALNCVSLNWLA